MSCVPESYVFGRISSQVVLERKQRAYTMALSRVFGQPAAFSLPVKTVYGVPLPTVVARAANGVPRTAV